MQKPKLSFQEQIQHLKSKGIEFELCVEKDAEDFLKNSNYLFKIKSFARNYQQHNNKYHNLDFAYLKEWSTLDMHLRKLILSISLDIEHMLKIELLKDFNSNPQEDGYQIVVDFFNQQQAVETKIQSKAKSSSLIKNLLDKNPNVQKLPLWTLLEILDFGDFLKLYKFYFERYPNKNNLAHQGMAQSVRILRNAAAHNTCILNTLREPYNTTFDKPNKNVQTCISSIRTISSSTRKTMLKNPTLHDCTSLILLFNEICTSPQIKLHRNKQILLFLQRCKKHSNYFKKENYFVSRYNFIAKVFLHYIYK